MVRGILLALVALSSCARRSLQMMPVIAAQRGLVPTTNSELDIPCHMLSSVKSEGVIHVLSRRMVSGEEICVVPNIDMPLTMDELIDNDERNAEEMETALSKDGTHRTLWGAYIGTVPPCDGVLLNKDMCLTRRQNEILRQYHTLDNFHSGRWKRKALTAITARWTNNIVPYEIRDGVFSGRETALIEEAMREWERGTCLTFRPANNFDNDKISIQSGMGCYSRIGRVGGSQELSLGTGICRTKKVIMHEIGHAIGLIHEHQRDDRDRYVSIVNSNVEPQFMDQFNKISPSVVDVSSVKYDYLSLMHYGKNFFSTDGQSTTIRTTDPAYQDVIGRVQELSFSDFKSVNIMYQCAASCPTNVYCLDDGYVNQNCRCVCRDGTDSCTASRSVSTTRRQITPPRRQVLPPRRQVTRLVTRGRPIPNRRNPFLPFLPFNPFLDSEMTNGTKQTLTAQQFPGGRQGQGQHQVIQQTTRGGHKVYHVNASNTSSILGALLSRTRNVNQINRPPLPKRTNSPLVQMDISKAIVQPRAPVVIRAQSPIRRQPEQLPDHVLRTVMNVLQEGNGGDSPIVVSPVVPSQSQGQVAFSGSQVEIGYPDRDMYPSGRMAIYPINAQAWPLAGAQWK